MTLFKNKTPSYYFFLAKVLSKAYTDNITPGLVSLHNYLTGFGPMFFDKKELEQAADNYTGMYQKFIHDNMVLALQELCLILDDVLMKTHRIEYLENEHLEMMIPNDITEMIEKLDMCNRSFRSPNHHDIVTNLSAIKSILLVSDKSLGDTINRTKYTQYIRTILDHIRDTCNSILGYRTTKYTNVLKEDTIRLISEIISIWFQDTYVKNMVHRDEPVNKRYNISNEVTICLASNFEVIPNFNIFVDSNEISSPEAGCVLRELFSFKRNV